jgi:mono/diheme cytochrome c family protein
MKNYKNRFILRKVPVLFLVMGLIACDSSDLHYKDEAPSLTSIVSSNGLEVLSNHCAACHGSVTGGSGGINDILNVDKLISDGLLVPGSPDTSPLYQEVESGRMPATGKLPDYEIATLRQWILDGLVVVGPAPTPKPIAPLGPTYQSLYENIFLPKCVACHNATTASRGVRLDTYEYTIQQINLANPTQSRLYQVTSSGKMPKSPSTPLNADELNTLLTWIENGALNN